MRLEKVIIEGFRSYQTRVEIELSSLTAFIGENDVGKSSILEALEAFFNDAIEVDDLNVRADRRTITIGCVFSNLPREINLDAGAPTSLENEYLLNGDGKLELYKSWRATATKVELERVYARAVAPTNAELSDLLFKKQDELRKLIGEFDLDADKRSNPSMRRALYEHFARQEQLLLELREVELDRPKDRMDVLQDARRLWKKLNDRHLPVYSLFKAEQVRGDKEATVRSPLDATLKRAIKELEPDLSAIHEKIEKEVQETTQRTLERLRRDYPEIAQDLVPEYKPPAWSKAFDLDVLRGDDDVPLNKRGAGVRRLVVLAFFQAEAEKKRQERSEGVNQAPVIYAVEEPETSQHPNFQRAIIEAFKGLVEGGDQVILTTHVPGLAELLPIDSIRFIDRPTGAPQPRVRSGANDKDVLREAAASLGVLPSAVPSENAQIAVWVEGDTDVWVLESVGSKLKEAGLVPAPLDVDRIFYIFGGGGDQLKSFVNGEYLNALGLPQFYLRDSDKVTREESGKPIPDEVKERVRKWNEEKIGPPIAVRVTRKREIENYVNPATLNRLFGCPVDIEKRLGEFDIDFDDISSKKSPFWVKFKEAKDELGFRIPEVVRRGVVVRHTNPKHVICGVLLYDATLEELRARCSTTDPSEAACCEFEEWFREMAGLIEAGGA